MTETTLTQEHIDFLDELRESGDTNMFGARPYIVDEFGVDKHEAAVILSAWMSHHRE